MAMINTAKAVGWTLLNIGASGLAGAATGGLVKVIKDKDTTNCADGMMKGFFGGIIASILPPASGHFASRTLMATIGGAIGSFF